MNDLDALLGQRGANQLRAMTLLGPGFAAEERHTMPAFPGRTQTVDALAEGRSLAADDVVHPPLRVIAGRLPGAPTQLLAQIQVSDVMAGEMTLERIVGEVGMITGVGSGAQIGEEGDVVLSEQRDRLVYRALAV